MAVGSRAMHLGGMSASEPAATHPCDTATMRCAAMSPAFMTFMCTPPMGSSRRKKCVYAPGTSSGASSASGPRPWCALLCTTNTLRAYVIFP